MPAGAINYMHLISFIKIGTVSISIPVVWVPPTGREYVSSYSLFKFKKYVLKLIHPVAVAQLYQVYYTVSIS